jgi:hypothetical protein
MKEVNKLLAEICLKGGFASNKREALTMGKDKYLHVEYNRTYGGYRLVNVKVDNDGHFGTFGQSSCCKRLPKSKMLAYMQEVLESLAQKNN